MTKDQLLAEAKKLEPRELEALVEDLWQHVGPTDLSTSQLAELRRRICAVDSGEMETIPGEEVMAELRQRFSRR